jgi:hypothetical protein
LSSVLEGVGSDGLQRERRLPRAEQRVGDLRDVDGRAGQLEDLEHAGERLQPVGQLGVARAQHGVVGVHRGQLGVDGGDARLRLRVLGLEAGHLGDQLLHALLLARAGPARRLPVREHPLALALVGGAVAAVGEAVGARAPARRRHGPDRFPSSPPRTESVQETDGREKFTDEENLREI